MTLTHDIPGRIESDALRLGAAAVKSEVAIHGGLRTAKNQTEFARRLYPASGEKSPGEYEHLTEGIHIEYFLCLTRFPAGHYHRAGARRDLRFEVRCIYLRWTLPFWPST